MKETQTIQFHRNLFQHFTEDGRFPKARQILGLLGFLGFANVYAMRVNLSVAIVAMVNHTAIPSQNKNITDTCQANFNNETIPVSPIHT